MIRAYDEIYLDGAMIRLGDMLEYACMDCSYDPDAYWKMFLKSGYARRFEIGDASVVSGKSGPELAAAVLSEVDCKTDFPKAAWREYRSDLYWSGWILAYYQWYTAQSFYAIWKDISIRMLQKCYGTLHEADVSKAVEALRKMQTSPQKQTIANLRAVRGLTQQELADRARMSLSQLQRLEYGERKVSNLTLKTALALAKALGVEVEEMM